MCFRQLYQESRWLASINDGRWDVLLSICFELARQRHFKMALLVQPSIGNITADIERDV